MAGHSKWANIKNRKGAQDAKRAKIFNKLSREIMVAAQKGGDPALNPVLRLALAKARAQSMPKKNIETAIEKATGAKSGASNYQELAFAGNVHGVALLIHTLSDNVNRITPEISHLISRAGGALTGLSAASHIFTRTGVLEVPLSAGSYDDMMIKALDAGADDIEEGEDSYFIYTAPHELSAVREKLESVHNIKEFRAAESRYLPNQEVLLPKAKAESFLELIDKLEDHDDVQEVFHNLDVNSLN